MIPAILVFFLSSCGYSLHERKDFRVEDVRIGKIENRTTEPRLDDKLAAALSNEMLREGLILKDDSKNEVYGTIDKIQYLGISETGIVFNAYEIILKGKFYLRTADGKSIQLRGENPFITTFPASADLNTVFADREVALDSALKGLSTEIVSGIVYK